MHQLNDVLITCVWQAYSRYEQWAWEQADVRKKAALHPLWTFCRLSANFV